jgi:hypothetical protein
MMNKWVCQSVWLMAVCCLLVAPAWAQKPGALLRDKTGIQWVYPFSKAQARARADNRLLLIKPVAFGSSADGGW